MSRTLKTRRRRPSKSARRPKKIQKGGLSCGNVFRLKKQLEDNVRNLSMSQRAKYSACKHLLSRKKYDVYFPDYRRSKKSVKDKIKLNRRRKEKEEMDEVIKAPNLTTPERVAVRLYKRDWNNPHSLIKSYKGTSLGVKNLASAYTKAGIVIPHEVAFAAKHGMSKQEYTKHFISTMTPKQQEKYSIVIQ